MNNQGNVYITLTQNTLLAQWIKADMPRTQA